MIVTTFVTVVMLMTSAIRAQEMLDEMENVWEEEARAYIRHLFRKYGNGHVMTFEGFEHLLIQLGLGEIHIDHDIKSHYHGTEFVHMHSNHNHNVENHDEHEHSSDDHYRGHNDSLKERSHTNASQQTLNPDDLNRDLPLRNNSDLENGLESFRISSINLQNNTYNDNNNDPRSDDDYKNQYSRSRRNDRVNGNGRNRANIKGENSRTVVKRLTEDVKSALNDTVSIRNETEVETAFITGMATATVSQFSNDSNTTIPPSSEKCLSPVEILGTFKINWREGISESHFLYLGPALISQLEANKCSRRAANNSHLSTETSYAKAWLMSVTSVIVISLVGLLSVTLIPVTHKVYYQHLIQFLVALAIGCLTGDALLHLLPHAIAPHSHQDVELHNHDSSLNDNHDSAESASHKDAVWKGMMALAGIYAFFIMEQSMAILTRWKRQRKRRLTASFDPDLTLEDVGAKLSRHNDDAAANEDFMLVVHPGKSVKMLADDAYEEMAELKVCENGCHKNYDEKKSLHKYKDNKRKDNKHNDNEHNDNKQVHRSHSHSSHHGHSHSVPKSVTAVAWMVIMGDGLHNFTDGLAIGAAYFNDLSLGLGTTIAVFCHELPHELGDFAMLLHAGMRVKQALFYNVFSSVLCFMGMLLGIFVGKNSSASSWIFALTAGIFIYIALVDMLPEMAAIEPKESENRLCFLLLQLCGITCGTVIMLIIALFEDKIKTLFDDWIL